MNDGFIDAYIGIGSNLDDPQARVSRALDDLAGLPGCRCAQHSALYRSPPMGPPDQPDYVNAVVRLATGLEAVALLHHLQVLEDRAGRVRERHWGPRTLDLDILLYGDEVIEEETLRVPHPGLTGRAFVVCPLLEIAPGLVIPGKGPLRDYRALCAGNELERLPGV